MPPKAQPANRRGFLKLAGATALAKSALARETAFGEASPPTSTPGLPPLKITDVHVDISIPKFGIQEMVFFPEVTREVLPGAPEFKDGYMRVRDAPGLGTDLNEALARKYPYKRAYLPMARRRDGSVQDW